MALSFVTCSFCKKDFLKDNKYINENIKLGLNCYCSLKCQYSFKSKKTELSCENPKCDNTFQRQPKDISPHNYCSRSCAASINNIKFPKRFAAIRRCDYCNNNLLLRRKYCSSKCRSYALMISKEELIYRIKDFYKKYKRIPVKREMNGIYKPAREYFGTWNNAIEAAGFSPNPVLFANHQIANDGHLCDSLAEKLIDDYLCGKNIKHERCVPYPESNCTIDFKIGNTFVEYFGLAGEHKRYDQLRKMKQKMAKKYKIKLVEIYPKDLYPHNKMDSILGS